MFLTVLPVAPDILLVRPSSRSVTTETRSAIADTKPCSCSPSRFNPSWPARDSAPPLSCELVLVAISTSPSTCWRGTPSTPRGPGYWLFRLLVSGCLLLLRFVGGLFDFFALFLFVLVSGLFGFFALFLFVLVSGLFGFFALFLFVLVSGLFGFFALFLFVLVSGLFGFFALFLFVLVSGLFGFFALFLFVLVSGLFDFFALFLFVLVSGLFDFFALFLFVLVSGLFGFFALFLLELGDLDLDSERLHDLSRGGCDPRCANNRCDCGEDTTDAFGVDIELACHFEVHHIREQGGIDRDERSDANKHECFRVEARCGHRVGCHVCEKIENRSLSSRFSHGASFRSDERSSGQDRTHRPEPQRSPSPQLRQANSSHRPLQGINRHSGVFTNGWEQDADSRGVGIDDKSG